MTATDDALTALWSPRARNAPAPANVPPGHPVEVNFDQGLPDPALFPVDALKQCLVDTLDEEGAESLKYFAGESAEDMRYGHRALRDALASRLRARGVTGFDAANVALVNGSTDGLALAVAAFLGPGDGAVVEAATYPHTRNFISATGARVETVPLDEHGMVVDALPACLQRLRDVGAEPKLVYTIPTFHAPTGTVLPYERRERLLEIAAEWRVVVLEDNCYYEFGYDEPPPPSLLQLDRHGLVVQSDSFSKYIAPGLRMAWLAGPHAAIEAVGRVRQDFAVSQLLARALLRFVERGHLDAHLEELRVAYRRKRDLTTAALRAHCEPLVRFAEPSGGFYFWLELSDVVDWEAARANLAARGIAFRPGSQFVTSDAASGTGGATGSVRHLRISPIQVPEADIERGIAALGDALRAAAAR